jgi:hypothetical protein
MDSLIARKINMATAEMNATAISTTILNLDGATSSTLTSQFAGRSTFDRYTYGCRTNITGR